MPGMTVKSEPFKKGEPILARDLNAIARRVSFIQLPGSYMSGGVILQHPPRTTPGTSGSSDLRIGRVTTAFSSATGPAAADWADGEVLLQDEETGEFEYEPTECKNQWIGVSWVEDAQVLVNMAYTPPRIVNGTCAAVSWDSGSS